MKVLRSILVRSLHLTLGLAALSVAGMNPQAYAQAPYLLPYNIQQFAASGTAPAVGATCTGTNGATGTAYDAQGDGCPISSGMVVIGSSSDLHDVVVDPAGNVYFIDNQSANAVIRRIDGRSGIVTVYAGTSASPQPTVNLTACTAVQDLYGDGCPANDGKANTPPAANAAGAVLYGYTSNLVKSRGLGINRNGDLYLADYTGYLIHKISASTGLMTIVAGLLGGGTAAKPTANKGQKGYVGDGGLATAAEENSARGVGVDLAGNVYIADSGNNVVRKVTAATGIITTIAGSTSGVASFSGDGGPATAATLTTPEDIELSPNGDIYIADFGNSRVRVIYMGGATTAKLISLTNGGTVPTIGNIYTILGGGTAITTYTPGSLLLSTSVAVGSPRKIALDARGNVYLADNGDSVIWFLDSTTGYMRVIAGTFGATSGAPTCATQQDAFGDNCPGQASTLLPNSAMGVSVDAFGAVYISDSGDKILRKVQTDQTFPTVAFGSSATQNLLIHFAVGDGPAAATPFVLNGSTDYALRAQTCTANTDGTTDCLLPVTFKPSRPGPNLANLTVTSLLNGTNLFGISGVGSAAALALDPGTTAAFATGLTNPGGIAQDGAGNTYIADTGKNRVLQYTAAGTMTVIAGTGTAGYTGDSGPASSATLNAPAAVTVARNGFVYIADTGNNVVRRIDPATGTISTFGGGGTPCTVANDALGDGCLGTQATFLRPAGLSADNDGNVYVSDTGNNVVRELTFGGVVEAIAGGASSVCGAESLGNGCPPAQTIFKGPTALQVDSRNFTVCVSTIIMPLLGL